ncbi:bifunctional hydroxymethylpyrimidine kinase/phosphomethylpyrimidine kinase [bacterium endosymbiont of Pedicinus badii]|uniref:bifunctional hydroxymethylpyrimidine kinase/phosphomethylpyrimidine kinase n=1 Tax=bacterium endosymbiont of Pedicinus badii TaxID=1719126 RepID=UPI0009B9DF14|nr:bifunctional hydroxymethylpyrimidine kinase/phosphomethylpyrimidine kinase [bacterium endosymbiont of Pedicinus badii]OQM34479.1 hypothetical protein AOQ89_01155 [bacterium endosymbiont of Pedicinus badii]
MTIYREKKENIQNALTIAGSDSCGGAGIQADLKTFSALGLYGLSAITSLTAQNTMGVKKIYSVDPIFFKEQLVCLFEDIDISTVKIGMLENEKIIKIVFEVLEKYRPKFIVLDPVMFSKNGNLLIEKKDINNLKEFLLPIASIITPNILESAMLTNKKTAENEEEIMEQGEILKKICKRVLIKGGHYSKKDSSDWFFSKNKKIRFYAQRIKTKRKIHGTGCTFSSALASFRVYKKNWIDSVQSAKTWIQKCIIKSNFLKVGKGLKVLNHFYECW